MRQQSRTKQISVKYKGRTLTQTPWTDYEGRKQYAKQLWNDIENREEYHAGYSKHLSHKELRLEIRFLVDKYFPVLMKLAEERENNESNISN